ncbi:MAG TPA: symmetrical bis(5'-nucleosyl)-tetraphosphatase [Noviherbaspirillum sp.]|jgi:bis(5'-nucleosyl)-tetraphosphatase (symmetrical)|uniref:symmetrical bis(5'-nucleosyl)-tetraphosphatase n=1 Tax=Noviherbaspirillum sp. TaxID=1926288 RepID=UPI002F941CA5
MSTYAIGDIQGCRPKMTELLERILETDPHARLIFVGDLVNRGPESLATLREVRALGDRAEVVLGNHDLHLLAVSQGIRPAHRSDTLDDILAAPDRDALLDWLRQRPLALYEDGHLMVHAGVLPQWDAGRTMALASEVETALRGPGWVDFLRTMYGNAPARWDDSLQGPDRLRCIVNALTRIRFCAPDGTMDLASKGATPDLPGYLPWFEVPGRRTQDVTVVFGHWSTLGLMMRENVISLDTGCLWGGKLSACRLQDRSVVQVDCPQFQRPGSI